jgi:hypothetical protein
MSIQDNKNSIDNFTYYGLGLRNWIPALIAASVSPIPIPTGDITAVAPYDWRKETAPAVWPLYNTD